MKVDQTGGLIVTGFDDGVVRLLELYDPHKVAEVHHERRPVGEAKLRLKQALKPHNEPVTAVAFDLNGMVLATGVRHFPLSKCCRFPWFGSFDTFVDVFFLILLQKSYLIDICCFNCHR